MKYLVTGGAGFIGSHLVDRLLEKDNQVIMVDNLDTGKKSNLKPNNNLEAHFIDILDGLEAVRRRAIDRGLLLEPVAEDLPPEQICELIFEPGISTRDEVTTVSGRGVGLDAVKRTVESLGGTVRVESQPGRGTAFEIELSSMAALQRVLVLEVSGERVALPVAPVEAVLAVGEGRVERAGGEAFFVWKDEPIPLIDLAERLVLAPPPADRAGNVVVLDARGFRLGLRIRVFVPS